MPKAPGQWPPDDRRIDSGPHPTHTRTVKTDYYKIRADAALALVVSDAMSRTGLGQSDVLRLGSLRGVPDITIALTGGEYVPRISEAELRKRINRLRLRTRLTRAETDTVRKQGRK